MEAIENCDNKNMIREISKRGDIMKFLRYDSTERFAEDVLDVLMMDEVQNNLQISFLSNKTETVKDWLMACIKDEDGGVLLTAVCTPPFNIVLYETGNNSSEGALELLSKEVRDMGFPIPGVLAAKNTAMMFAQIYADNSYQKHIEMKAMKLEKVELADMARGAARPAREEDMYYLPYWEKAFTEECRVETFSIVQNAVQIRSRIPTNTRYIWEDGIPVSQASHHRSTVNGAVINSVYTPPFYRGRGYAASNVASLSQHLLDRGSKFCALFADADNPISCSIYRKIGFKDVCTFLELKLRTK